MSRTIFRAARKTCLYLILCILLVAGALSLWPILREQAPRAGSAPQSGRHIDAADVELFIQTLGEEKNPPIILIHGMAAWSETWRPVMEQLARGGWYVIAVDMPPFGYSERPENRDYWRVAQAGRLFALLQNLGIPKATVVAHSYGSRAALEFTMLHPEKVRSLVLVDPALNGIYGSSTQPSPIIDAVLSVTPVRFSFIALTMTNPFLSRILLEKFLYDPSDATDEILAIYRRPGNLQNSTRDMGHWIRGFLNGSDTGLSADVMEYKKLAIPVALIWGEEDATTPLGQGEQLKEYLHASLFVIPNVGHIPHIEDVGTFNATLTSALDAIAAQ